MSQLWLDTLISSREDPPALGCASETPGVGVYPSGTLIWMIFVYPDLGHAV